MAERSEAKSAKRSFASKTHIYSCLRIHRSNRLLAYAWAEISLLIFDAKLRFALSTSLRPAILCEIKTNNLFFNFDLIVRVLLSQVSSVASFFIYYNIYIKIHQSFPIRVLSSSNLFFSISVFQN